MMYDISPLLSTPYGSCRPPRDSSAYVLGELRALGSGLWSLDSALDFELWALGRIETKKCESNFASVKPPGAIPQSTLERVLHLPSTTFTRRIFQQVPHLPQTNYYYTAPLLPRLPPTPLVLLHRCFHDHFC